MGKAIQPPPADHQRSAAISNERATIGISIDCIHDPKAGMLG
jgi:hypothetical protein